jgi:CubicO group peptidase (beta-lactamase class C family)
LRESPRGASPWRGGRWRTSWTNTSRQLEEEKVPGATVSVVEDGKVLFAKGYGQAGVQNNEPVVAGETLFRIASTSKLFTSTAVMQLVKEGKLDLDRDVNYYLDDVEIPDTYPVHEHKRLGRFNPSQSTASGRAGASRPTMHSPCWHPRRPLRSIRA